MSKPSPFHKKEFPDDHFRRWTSNLIPPKNSGLTVAIAMEFFSDFSSVLLVVGEPKELEVK